MNIDECKSFYKSAGGRGVDHETAFYLAVKSSKGIPLDDFTQKRIADQMRDICFERREQGDSHTKARHRCEAFAEEEPRDIKRDGSRIKRYAFENLANMAESLPGGGRGSLFNDEQRCRQSRAQHRPHVRTGNHWKQNGPFVTEDRYPGGRGPYKTEDRQPSGNWQSGNRAQPSRGPSNGGSKNGAFYVTETHTPDGVSYTYIDTHTHFTSDAPPPPPQPSRGKNDRPRGTYNTEDRRPGGHSRGQSAREPRPCSPPPQSSLPRSPPPSDSRSPPGGIKRPVDLYTVLGISRSASVDEIKKAYRKLCMKWHPDRTPEADKRKATDKMAEINQAHDVLSDAKHRALYDRTGCLPSVDLR